MEHAQISGTIDQQTANAQAELAKLQTEVATLDAQAATAAKRFEESPSAEAHSAREVAAQLAKNARAKLTARTEHYAPLFEAAAQRARAERLEQLQPAMDWNAQVNATAARLSQVYSDFLDGLETELGVAMRSLETYDQSLAEYNSLVSVHGGEPRQKQTVERMMATVRAQLVERFGKRFGGGNQADRGAHLNYLHLGQGADFFEATIRFPAKVNQRLL